ncbi:ribbon-helix-helix protein, CopG family [Microseira wollei]|uniref:Ribbon-helix-helix protein CopG domain-containing protein n=1 Tax=Microseira wollei NIES-4236 TaxID=2530354 RepID=A0AAV3XP24_9CYAN|nr:ribbon-helix-helix protein, CopG family [Microseira wollei]GET42885.1 hypothetical protein MiSe_77030 [Microseira wollei NIES-4236]
MKNLRLDVKLSEYQMCQLAEEAARRGMTKSELIRSLIARLPEPLPQKNLRSPRLY